MFVCFYFHVSLATISISYFYLNTNLKKKVTKSLNRHGGDRTNTVTLTFHSVSLFDTEKSSRTNLGVLGNAAHASGISPRRLGHSLHPHARGKPNVHGAHTRIHRRTREASPRCHLLEPQVVKSDGNFKPNSAQIKVRQAEVSK